MVSGGRGSLDICYLLPCNEPYANCFSGADFSLKLPGFSLSVLGYIGKQDSLRYVTYLCHNPSRFRSGKSVFAGVHLHATIKGTS